MANKGRSASAKRSKKTAPPEPPAETEFVEIEAMYTPQATLEEPDPKPRIRLQKYSAEMIKNLSSSTDGYTEQHRDELTKNGIAIVKVAAPKVPPGWEWGGEQWCDVLTIEDGKSYLNRAINSASAIRGLSEAAAIRELHLAIHNVEALVRYLDLPEVQVATVDTSSWSAVSDAARSLHGVLRQACETASPKQTKPQWDKDAGVLIFNGEKIIKYRQRATNQMAVLESFEELGWPAEIDSPLRRSDNVDTAEQVQETVKSLNRKQTSIRFSTNGRGTGFHWSKKVKI